MHGEEHHTERVSNPPQRPSVPGNQGRATPHARPDLPRWLYVHNPFYAISAALVFAGLTVSFDTSGETFEAGLLMAALSGYTLLLAFTALLVVRWGRVWDDARSLLLLVVIMLLALSVTFDETLARNPRMGIAINLAGLGLGVLISELLLRGLGIRLPAWYRLPYYALLSLFFLYPPALLPLISDPDDPALSWGLFGFSPAAATAFALLVPAIRRRAAYVRDNGTPWTWPWFPWTLFGVLWFCAAARSYYLCVSLHFVRDGQLIFSHWFLVPLMLASAVLLLEAGIVARRRDVQRAALLVPVVTVSVALMPQKLAALAAEFRDIFETTLAGTPAFWTLVVVAGFYTFAAVRRVPLAAIALTGSLVALAVVGPATRDFHSLAFPRAWPLLGAAAVQMVAAIGCRDARCWLAATVLGTLGLTIEFEGTFWTQYGIFWPLNFALLIVLVLGAVAGGRHKQWLSIAAAILVVVGTWAALSHMRPLIGDLPPWQADAYPLAVAAVAVAYGRIVERRPLLVGGALAGVSWMAVFAERGYQVAREHVVGLDRIAWGIVFFLVAAGISLWKARSARISRKANVPTP